MRSLELISILSTFREPEDGFAVLKAAHAMPAAELRRAFDVTLRAGQLEAGRARALLATLRTLAAAAGIGQAFAGDDEELRQVTHLLQEVEAERRELAERHRESAPLRERVLALEDRRDELQGALAAAETEIAALQRGMERIAEIRQEVAP